MKKILIVFCALIVLGFLILGPVGVQVAGLVWSIVGIPVAVVLLILSFTKKYAKRRKEFLIKALIGSLGLILIIVVKLFYLPV